MASFIKFQLNQTYAGADPGFLERGFIYIKVCVCVRGGEGVALLILSHCT